MNIIHTCYVDEFQASSVKYFIYLRIYISFNYALKRTYCLLQVPSPRTISNTDLKGKGGERIRLRLLQNVTPSSLVEIYQHFGGTCCLRLYCSVLHDTLTIIPKRLYFSIMVHRVTCQKTVM
jgi:hypothetical protein